MYWTDRPTDRQYNTQTPNPEVNHSYSMTIPATNVGTRRLGIPIGNPEFVEDACLESANQELTYVKS